MVMNHTDMNSKNQTPTSGDSWAGFDMGEMEKELDALIHDGTFHQPSLSHSKVALPSVPVEMPALSSAALAREERAGKDREGMLA